jgi:hypothetical protein
MEKITAWKFNRMVERGENPDIRLHEDFIPRDKLSEAQVKECKIAFVEVRDENYKLIGFLA